jgi:acyl carrier protein
MNENLREAIAEELEVEPSELTNEKLLEEIEEWDSVTALTVVVLLSDEVGVPITPAEMAGLRTYGDIEALVMQKKSSSQ